MAKTLPRFVAYVIHIEKENFIKFCCVKISFKYFTETFRENLINFILSKNKSQFSETMHIKCVMHNYFYIINFIEKNSLPI